MTITVLMVAPVTNLDYAEAEMQALVNLAGLRIRLVRAPCTTLSIYAAVEHIGHCEWLHIAGHGSEGGVHLDSETWSAQEIVQTVQSLGCNLVYLNTCDSIHLVKLIGEKTSADCIANLTEANDQRAWQSATHFARQLLRTNPVAAYLKTVANDKASIYVRSLIG